MTIVSFRHFCMFKRRRETLSPVVLLQELLTAELKLVFWVDM